MVFTVVKRTLELHDTPKPLRGRQVELQKYSHNIDKINKNDNNKNSNNNKNNKIVILCKAWTVMK